MDGSFEEREHKSGVVPFKIFQQRIQQNVCSCGYIDMNYAQFVKGLKILSIIKQNIYSGRRM